MSTPLTEQLNNCDSRIAELESGLHAARTRRTDILRRLERADTIPAPPPNCDSIPVDFEWDGDTLPSRYA